MATEITPAETDKPELVELPSIKALIAQNVKSWIFPSTLIVLIVILLDAVTLGILWGAYILATTSVLGFIIVSLAIGVAYMAITRFVRNL